MYCCHSFLRRRREECAGGTVRDRFDDYFTNEQNRLRKLADDGRGSIEPGAIRLTPVLARLLVRVVVAAVFDAYWPPNACRDGVTANRSSKVG